MRLGWDQFSRPDDLGLHGSNSSLVDRLTFVNLPRPNFDLNNQDVDENRDLLLNQKVQTSEIEFIIPLSPNSKGKEKKSFIFIVFA